jgi:hypothetical protein
MVCWLSPWVAAAPTLVGINTQPTTWWGRTLEGWQHHTATVANSCHHRCPPRIQWQDSCGDNQDIPGNIQMPHSKNLPFTTCNQWTLAIFSWAPVCSCEGQMLCSLCFIILFSVL